MKKRGTIKFIFVFCIALFGIAMYLGTFKTRMKDFENISEGAMYLLRLEMPYGLAEYFAPPWWVIVVAPFLGPQGHSLWLAFNAIVIFLVFGLTISCFSKSQRSYAIGALFLLSPTTIIILILGQNVGIIMFALMMFYYRKDKLSAGEIFLYFFLLSGKPHLVWLPALVICMHIWKNHRKKIFAALLAGLILVWVTNLIYPDWINHMAQAWAGGQYKVSGGVKGIYDLGVPLVLGIIASAFVLALKCDIETKFAIAASVGLAISPYSRGYDLIILFIPAVIVFQKNKIIGLLSLWLSMVWSLPGISAITAAFVAVFVIEANRLLIAKNSVIMPEP